MAFLLNSQTQGVSGKMNNLPKHHDAGPQRRGAQCSRIGCIGLRPALHIYMGVILRPHPVRGESHIERNASGEVATILLWKTTFALLPLFQKGKGQCSRCAPVLCRPCSLNTAVHERRAVCFMFTNNWTGCFRYIVSALCLNCFAEIGC